MFKFCIGLLAMLATAGIQAGQFNVLLFTKTNEWHHQSIVAGVSAMQTMSENHFFELEWHEDANKFTDKFLQSFDVIVFMLTSGDILNAEQQAAMQRFIRAGGGFVGIHSAADTERGWGWYTKLVGRTFIIHPAVQTAALSVIDRSFPGLEYMPDRFLWTDEWYEFGSENEPGLNYLLSVDEKTFNPRVDWGDKSGTGMGDFHPVAWYHTFDGGRAFYTSLGHMPATYKNKVFIEHIYGGLYWAATGRGIRDLE